MAAEDLDLCFVPERLRIDEQAVHVEDRRSLHGSRHLRTRPSKVTPPEPHGRRSACQWNANRCSARASPKVEQSATAAAVVCSLVTATVCPSTGAGVHGSKVTLGHHNRAKTVVSTATPRSQRAGMTSASASPTSQA